MEGLRRILKRDGSFPGGIAFAGSQFVFAGYRGCHFPTARSICDCGQHAERSGWGRSPRTGCDIPRQRFYSIRLGARDLREIQELLRHKNIRTTVRYTDVGYEQTRQTAEALSRALE